MLFSVANLYYSITTIYEPDLTEFLGQSIILIVSRHSA